MSTQAARQGLSPLVDLSVGSDAVSPLFAKYPELPVQSVWPWQSREMAADAPLRAYLDWIRLKPANLLAPLDLSAPECRMLFFILWA